MATRIQLRRDTAANWTSNNPTLANGEMGVETDTFKFKIGNGSTAWNALQYASSTSSYADSDVDVHLNTSTAVSGEYLTWNGSDYEWNAIASEALEVQDPARVNEYYIYVGNTSNKLALIQDTRGYESDLVYDQEFATLQEAFDFVMSNHLRDVGYSPNRDGNMGASWVIALEEDVTHAAPTGGHFSLSHVPNHVVLISQNGLDPSGPQSSNHIATLGTSGDLFVISGLTLLQLGGDLIFNTYMQSTNSVVVPWGNSYWDVAVFKGSGLIQRNSSFQTSGNIEGSQTWVIQDNSIMRFEGSAVLSGADYPSFTVRRGSSLRTFGAKTLNQIIVEEGSWFDTNNNLTLMSLCSVNDQGSLTVAGVLDMDGINFRIQNGSKITHGGFTNDNVSSSPSYFLGSATPTHTEITALPLLNKSSLFLKDGCSVHNAAATNNDVVFLDMATTDPSDSTSLFLDNGIVTQSGQSLNNNIDTHLNVDSATSGQFLSWNGTDYAWDSVAAGYTDSAVNTHLNVDSATSGQFLSWNGTDYAWDSVTSVSIDESGRSLTGNFLSFGAGDQFFFKTNPGVSNSWSGIGNTAGYQFDLSTVNQKMIIQDGADGVRLIGYHKETGGNEGLELHGIGFTANKSTVRIITNSNEGLRVVNGVTTISNAFTLPSSDGTANQVLTTDGAGTVTWDSAGSGGGLDSAAVAALIDSDLQNPTILTIGSSSSRIAIGSGASAGIFRAIGIGDGATATGTDAVAVGYNTLADGSGSVAIGNGADAGGASAIAIGSNSNASNTSDTSVGLRANSTGGSATAIGSDADATGSRSTAVGNSSQSTATYTTTLGWGASASVTNSTAIGYTSNASGTKSSSLGSSANASGDYSIAIGADTTSSGNNSISISAGTSSFTNSNVNGIDIRTSDSASIHYSQDSDFVFGAGVTMTDLVSTGATIVFNNLPTSDPVNAGQLWNDAGTLKVSAG